MAPDFYELGFDPVMEISAEHGMGIGDLLDEVIERLPERKSEEQKAEEPEPRIAIVGRPNVGKSSLVNRILREERMLVSDVAGTTRDSVDTNFRWLSVSSRSSTPQASENPGEWRAPERSSRSACFWRNARLLTPISSCW